MMRSKIFCFSFLFLCVSSLTVANSPPVVLQQNDLYWISYSDGGIKFFLMQIDSVGNVTKASNQIIFRQNVSSSVGIATAISKNGADKINLWIPERRIVIDKETLKVLKIINNGISTENWRFIKVTQKAQQNFLVGLRESAVRDDFCYPHFLNATGVSPIGEPNHSAWVVSPDLCVGFIEFFCESCGGAVSSDGKTAYWFTLIGDPFFGEFGDEASTKLLIRNLDDSGRPVSEPIEMPFDDFIYEDTHAPFHADVSDVLVRIPFAVKFVVFSTPLPPFRLFLQPVNAETGQLLGGRIHLRTRPVVIDDLAIDPLGRFVLFSTTNKDGVSFLFFQALDITGHASGMPKVLLRNGKFTGMDILKE